jgi:beta-glucosidase
MRQSRCKESLLFLLFFLTSITFEARAQVDYPFRNPTLSDDARIADLLKRLTLDEKVQLMDGHPQDPASPSCVFR